MKWILSLIAYIFLFGSVMHGRVLIGNCAGYFINLYTINITTQVSNVSQSETTSPNIGGVAYITFIDIDFNRFSGIRLDFSYLPGADFSNKLGLDLNDSSMYQVSVMIKHNFYGRGFFPWAGAGISLQFFSVKGENASNTESDFLIITGGGATIPYFKYNFITFDFRFGINTSPTIGQSANALSISSVTFNDLAFFFGARLGMGFKAF